MALERRWIDWIWGIAVAAILVSDVIPHLPTPVADRLNFEANDLEVFDFASRDTVLAAANYIQQSVPEDRKTVLRWRGKKPFDSYGSELAYLVYPRQIDWIGWVDMVDATQICQISWASETEVSVVCADSVWRYRSSAGSHR